jgi:hypothetical protein
LTAKVQKTFESSRLSGGKNEKFAMYFKDKKHSPSAFVGWKAHNCPTLQWMRLGLDFYT